MLGRFLEISLSTEVIAESMQFYQRLGFTPLVCSDVWPHPYGALTDGRLCIGLHQRTAGDPELSFVQTNLARQVNQLQRQGFEPESTRLGEADFHELRLRDPSGQRLALLEARTFSPPPDAPESRCGYFFAYGMPVNDVAAVAAYWERGGFVSLGAEPQPYGHTALTSDHLNIALHQSGWLNAPALVFADPQMPARLAALASLELTYVERLPRGLDRRGNAVIRAPEGTLLMLLTAES